MVGMVVAYNYQPRHNGANILLNLYSNYDQDEGHGGTVTKMFGSDGKVSQHPKFFSHSCRKHVRFVCLKSFHMDISDDLIVWGILNTSQQ